MSFPLVALHPGFFRAGTEGEEELLPKLHPRVGEGSRQHPYEIRVLAEVLASDVRRAGPRRRDRDAPQGFLPEALLARPG